MFKKTYNKRRYKKNGNYPKRGRTYPFLRKLDYQYSTTMQSMGPGTTIKNFERIVTITPNTNIRQTLTGLLIDDDFDSMCRSFRYIRIIGVCITQNNINMINEQDNVYVRIAWSENYEEQEDIEKDDLSKILPNIGRKRFMFRPPNAQLTLTELKKTINPSQFIATEHLLDQLEDEYKIPGSIELYNTTSQDRKIRIILRVIFRGSKVLDKVEEAKRVLMRDEKRRKKEEDKKKENVKEEDNK